LVFNPLKTINLKVLSYSVLPISERALLFGKFAGFSQHVDADKYGAMVERYDRGKLKDWRKPCSDCTLSTTDLAWVGL
jgi:hypothetical protein